MVNEEVEEEEVNEGDNDDYQEYFSFNIESQQDDDRHIANLLIVQENMSYLTQVRTSASHRENSMAPEDQDWIDESTLEDEKEKILEIIMQPNQFCQTCWYWLDLMVTGVDEVDQ